MSNILLRRLKMDVDKASESLKNLVDNWYNDEHRHYREYYDLEDGELEDISTNDLKPHNYKDLRILQDFIEDAYQDEKTKTILWDFIAEKDIPKIERRLKDE